MYSNAMAASTTMMNRIMRPAFGCGSGMLQDYLQDDVAGVAAAVDDFFQKLIEIAQENDLLGLVVAVLKIVEQLELEVVRVAFDGLETRVHLPGAGDVRALAQFLHHGEERFSRLDDLFEMLFKPAPDHIACE